MLLFDLPILPDMRCDRGCGQCCGIVPASALEYERVKRYAKRRGITPLDQGTRCPWYQDGQCAVHDARPLICRAFGHINDPRMTCPHGYNVNVSAAHCDVIHDALTAGEGTRLLHEIIPGWSPASLLEHLQPSAAPAD